VERSALLSRSSRKFQNRRTLLRAKPISQSNAEKTVVVKIAGHGNVRSAKSAAGPGALSAEAQELKTVGSAMPAAVKAMNGAVARLGRSVKLAKNAAPAINETIANSLNKHVNRNLSSNVSVPRVRGRRIACNRLSAPAMFAAAEPDDLTRGWSRV
jgi:hypothetical protein